MINSLLTIDLPEELTQAVDESIDMGVFENFFRQLPEKALQLGIRVVIALVFFAAGVQVIKIIRKIVKHSLQRANAEKGVIQFIDSFIKASLYVVLIFFIGNSFGLDAASVVAVLGSAGVAIGLAIQGSLSNLAGGVIILLVKPFSVGDYIIEDNHKNEGTVTEIQIFYTKLTTADEKVIVLPNGSLANSSITNVTGTSQRRLDIRVGISYDADLLKAKEVFLNVVERDPATLMEQTHEIVVEELGDSAVILCGRLWVKNEDYFSAKWRLNESVKLEFDKHHIEIPYNQLDVRIMDKSKTQEG